MDEAELLPILRSDALTMPVEAFFTERRLIELGVADQIVSRVLHGTVSMCRYDHASEQRRVRPLRTMQEFLEHYPTRESLKIPHLLCEKSVYAIVLAIMSATLPFQDDL